MPLQPQITVGIHLPEARPPELRELASIASVLQTERMLDLLREAHKKRIVSYRIEFAGFTVEYPAPEKSFAVICKIPGKNGGETSAESP